MKFCPHFRNMKPERISSLLSGFKPCCQNKAKHTPQKQNLWQCLHCTFVGCSRNNEAKCAKDHATKENHPLTLSVSEGEIFCYKCDQSLQEQIDLAKGMEMESEDLESVENFVDKCGKYCRNLGRNSQHKGSSKLQRNIRSVLSHTRQPKTNTQSKTSDQEDKSKMSWNPLTSTTKLNMFGLNNLGNTCFFNSVLQCMYASTSLHQLYPQMDFGKASLDNSPAQLVTQVYESLDKKELNYKKPLTTPSVNINRKFQALMNSGGNCKGVLNPSDLFEAVGTVKKSFRSMAQQDAQELLRFLVDGLNEGEITHLNINREYLKAIEQAGKRTKLTTIEKLFGCFLASRLHCLNCNKVSWNMDLCLDISIELTTVKGLHIELPSDKPIPSGEINEEGLMYPSSQAKLPPLLQHFFSAEPLTKANYFSCEKCKASKATKRFYIKDPPLNLTIVLKRFTNAGQKNNADIPFPMVLDVSAACINGGKWVYNLHGVCVHQGGARGGHYIAYTRRGNSWFTFSDSHWKEVSAEYVRSAQAYILFYQKG